MRLHETQSDVSTTIEGEKDNDSVKTKGNGKFKDLFGIGDIQFAVGELNTFLIVFKDFLIKHEPVFKVWNTVTTAPGRKVISRLWKE